MDSRAELTKALNNYEGAVLLISHDRSLMEAVVDRLWVVADGDIVTYDGSMEDYRRLQLEKNRAPRKKKSDKHAKNKHRRKGAQAREAIAPLKNAVTEFETDISTAKKQISDLDQQLAVSDLFTNNREKAVNLGQERVKLLLQLENLENEWLVAVEKYEAAIKGM